MVYVSGKLRALRPLIIIFDFVGEIGTSDDKTPEHTKVLV
jgi:hypothetical protein